MDELLRRHKHFCRAFIDDIVIFSDNAEDHAKHLESIFKLFKSKNIVLSLYKSYVGYPSVELLGFIVNGLGLSNTKDRIEAFAKLEFLR